MNNVAQRIYERLAQEAIKSVNNERLKYGKDKLTESQMQSLITEVEKISTLKEKLFEWTTVYDDAYIAQTVKDNIEQNDSIIAIIKKFIGIE